MPHVRLRGCARASRRVQRRMQRIAGAASLGRWQAALRSWEVARALRWAPGALASLQQISVCGVARPARLRS
jgi:hypothetical protein